MGVRDPKATQAAYDGLQYDTYKHHVSILPLDLVSLRGVKSFAQEALSKLGGDKLDYLFLNAALIKDASHIAPDSKWTEAYVVNHLCNPIPFSYGEKLLIILRP